MHLIADGRAIFLERREAPAALNGQQRGEEDRSDLRRPERRRIASHLR
jgi:hypothetical protein